MKILLSLLVFLTSNFSFCSGFLSEEDIARANKNASARFEDYVKEFLPSPKSRQNAFEKHWLTLSEFTDTYKDQKRNFKVANTFSLISNYGQLVLYPAETENSKIYLKSPKNFTNIKLDAAKYFTQIEYQYVPETDTKESYFILEYFSTATEHRNKGYGQAALKAFLEEFNKKQTSVKLLFADLRVDETEHYCQKYGFKPGVLKGYEEVGRFLSKPYYLKLENYP